MMDGIQPTIPIGNNDFGGNGGIWLFAILALMWGGGGMFGRNCNGGCATTEDSIRLDTPRRRELRNLWNAELEKAIEPFS